MYLVYSAGCTFQNNKKIDDLKHFAKKNLSKTDLNIQNKPKINALIMQCINFRDIFKLKSDKCKPLRHK